MNSITTVLCARFREKVSVVLLSSVDCSLGGNLKAICECRDGKLFTTTKNIEEKTAITCLLVQNAVLVATSQ